MAQADNVVELQPKVRPLEPARMKGGDFVRQIHCATAFDDTKPEDLLIPEYWAHVAASLHPWDRVEVVANDGSWWAELMVLDCGRNYARMAIMRDFDLSGKTNQAPLDMKAYTVKHRGPHSKWSVIRISDGAVVHEGSEKQDMADAWLKNHLIALGK
tara:strand:- start:17797 stop:18267 length:471 start_codon:yes stop_codon:yes gene_type:complete